MSTSSPIDVIYERQWRPMPYLIFALQQLGRMGRLYGGFPKFRYTKTGIPADTIRTFPVAALWNHAAGKLHLPTSLQLDEPRWVGNWVASHQDLAPTVWANGTAHRFLFPKLKDTGRTLILERGSSHPEPFFLLQQKARKEAGYTHTDKLPASVLDEIEKNRLADFLIAGSEMIRQGYIKHGFPSERAFSCSYGIDPDHFPYMERLSPRNRPLKIGIVGIVGFRKGLSRALFLGEWAKDRKYDVELHFVGPLFDQESRALISRSNAKVVLHGVVKGTPLLDLFHSFDLYMLPSYEDGFGLSVIEAMSTGIPAIVSHTTGAKEAIEHGVNGWCLEEFSYDVFDAHLKGAFETPESLNIMGLSAHHAVLKNYTSSHYCQRLNKALETIASFNK
jgi:glycosyltransferase involved in cell wall biosynthesis